MVFKVLKVHRNYLRLFSFRRSQVTFMSVPPEVVVLKVVLAPLVNLGFTFVFLPQFSVCLGTFTMRKEVHLVRA